ncbi:MAG: fimbrillin family protein [Bacteroidales bacterium]|nr:fimbrillin family protein [Bacteroidales bacterium]
MTGRYIHILLISLLTMASCQKPDGPDQNETAVPLSFSVSAEDAVAAKAGAGSEVTNNSNLTDKPFGIYGIYTATENEDEGTNVFLSSSAMEVRHDGTQWTYSPTAYWNINQFYRFRAYHPYSGDAFIVNPSSNTHRLMIEYKIASGQEDLLVGFKSVEANVTNIRTKVPITFRHALCALQFKIAFENSNDIPDDYTDDITNFHLHGIIPTGTLVYGHEEGDYHSEELKWIATYYDAADYYEWSGLKTFGKYDESNAVTIFDGAEGIVFAIPQTISSTPEKLTSVHFKTSRGGAADHQAILPSTTWEPGKIYTYTFLIKKSDIEVWLSIKDWNEIQSNENIYI